ncbi:MAG: hypothetical protein A2Y12_05470 [Planctomycetes bacterium GWF2_42_9]|nr:MAG: hypothetical protein A2Y12_05470 [Planctomycetes bacterium GWF2_42_9]
MQKTVSHRIDLRKAFTLVELLVVISIIAMLLSILMPSLNKVREKAKQLVCSTQTRQYSIAVYAYASDKNGQIPFFADSFQGGGPSTASFSEDPSAWFNVVGPYLGGKQVIKKEDSQAFAKVRRCPSGKRNKTAPGGWTGWIGVNYGGFDSTLAPFIYGSSKSGNTVTARYSPCKLSNVKHASTWMMLLDVQDWFVYSPTYVTWCFMRDTDHDGLPDTAWSGSTAVPIYNGANPKIHNNGTVVGLVDGHVEWVRFKELWKLDKGQVSHPFWYNK